MGKQFSTSSSRWHMDHAPDIRRCGVNSRLGSASSITTQYVTLSPQDLWNVAPSRNAATNTPPSALIHEQHMSNTVPQHLCRSKALVENYRARSAKSKNRDGKILQLSPELQCARSSREVLLLDTHLATPARNRSFAWLMMYRGAAVPPEPHVSVRTAG